MMTLGDSVYGWFGLAMLGFWFTHTLWVQYRELTVSARRVSEKILSSCTIAAACLVVGGYMWLQHGVPILRIVHRMAAISVTIPTGLRSTYTYLASLPTAVWIVSTWALTISTKWWSETMKNQSKMGAAPGNFTNTAPIAIEESTATTVNLASMERIGDMFLKLLRSEQQQQQTYVQEIREKVSTLLRGAESQKNGKEPIEVTSLKARISDLEKQMDNLKAVWLAATNVEETTKPAIVGRVMPFTNESDDEPDELEVYVAHQEQQRKKRRAEGTDHTAEQNEKGMKLEELQEFVGKDVNEIAAILNKRIKTEKEANRLPEHLTEEEKLIGARSLSELDRLWRTRADKAIRATDRLEIGALDADQLMFPRTKIQEIIRIRRKGEFHRRLLSEGKSYKECENCYKTIVQGRPHTCVQLNWKKSVRRNGLPAEERVVVSQTGQGEVRLRRQAVVDSNKLCIELQKLAQHQKMAEERLKASVFKEASRDTSKTEADAGVRVEEVEDPLSPQEAVVMVNSALSPSTESTLIRKDFF